MTKRVVEHEIKLEKSVKIILGVLALGVLLNAFAPAFSVTDAFAEWEGSDTIDLKYELDKIASELNSIASAIERK